MQSGLIFPVLCSEKILCRSGLPDKKPFSVRGMGYGVGYGVGDTVPAGVQPLSRHFAIIPHPKLSVDTTLNKFVVNGKTTPSPTKKIIVLTTVVTFIIFVTKETKIENENKIQTNKFYHADCLDILKDLPDKSVDLVFADVPYGVNKAEWDNYIPIDWFYETLRITDKILIAINNCNLHKIVNHFYEYYCQTIILFNQNGMLANKFSFDNYIPVVALGNWEFKQVQNVLPFTIKLNEKINHPSPKPLQAIEKLFNNYSNENDLILDCFSGSGTTAIACHNLNRRFICIEKDKEYFDKSVLRYENHIKQLKLGL